MKIKDERYYDWVEEVDPNCNLTEEELEIMYQFEISLVDNGECDEDNIR